MTAAFLTNVFFWSGLAIGGVVFAALLEVTGGEWSGPLRLIAERFRWFLPISFVSMAVVMWRSGNVYPWARQSLASPWFRPWFVALRVDLACAVVYAAAFGFCHAARRSREEPRCRSAMASAVLFLIVYALGFSLIAVDAIMSLEPRWTSTLFPAYIFTGNVYAGIAGVAVLATWNVGTRQSAMPPARSRDMANVLVAAALFWLYLFWSQFLVIWYGNLTAEVGYVMARLDGLRAVAWTVLAMCCAVPAIVLVPRWGKRAASVRVIAPLILIGIWLERWMLVAPDLPSRFPVLSALVITAAFATLFILSVGLESGSTMRRGESVVGGRN
jgi:hypothetical protein